MSVHEKDTDRHDKVQHLSPSCLSVHFLVHWNYRYGITTSPNLSLRQSQLRPSSQQLKCHWGSVAEHKRYWNVFLQRTTLRPKFCTNLRRKVRYASVVRVNCTQRIEVTKTGPQLLFLQSPVGQSTCRNIKMKKLRVQDGAKTGDRTGIEIVSEKGHDTYSQSSLIQTSIIQIYE